VSHVRLSRLLGHRRWALIPLALLGVAVSATFVGQALSMATIFGRVLADADGDLMSRLRTPIVTLAVLLALRPLLVLVREVLAVRLMTATKVRLRDDVAHQLTLESARDAGRGRTGSDNATVVDGIENLDPYLTKYLPSLMTSAMVYVVVAAVLLVIDPVVGVTVVLAAAAVPLLPRLWDRVLARRGADHWEAYQDLHAEFVDSMQGMTTLVLYGAADRRQRELATASDTLLKRTLRQLKVSLVESGLNSFALSAVPLLALLVVAVRRDQLSSAEIFAVVLLSVELVRPLRDLAAQWHAGYLGTFSGEQILQVLGRRLPDEAWPSEPALRGSVRLTDVTFTYPRSETPALQGVSLTADSGLTAVVGASGSGKSTIAALIAGLYDPTSGAIFLAENHSRAAERLRQVALVPQDATLFSGTVRSNLEIARPVGQRGGPTVEAAAAAAGIGLDDPALSLDSVVGERGGLLSGGQRQRIAIARGLLQDRQIMILDEATSALDVRSESLVVERVLELMSGRPVIVVAHRIAAISAAGSIIVMAGGRVAERGTHADLISLGGGYAQLAASAPLVGVDR
jgi:ATP-binding cassette subfamily C protein CydD